MGKPESSTDLSLQRIADTLELYRGKKSPDLTAIREEFGTNPDPKWIIRTQRLEQLKKRLSRVSEQSK